MSIPYKTGIDNNHQMLWQSQYTIDPSRRVRKIFLSENNVSLETNEIYFNLKINYAL